MGGIYISQQRITQVFCRIRRFPSSNSWQPPVTCLSSGFMPLCFQAKQKGRRDGSGSFQQNLSGNHVTSKQHDQHGLRSKVSRPWIILNPDKKQIKNRLIMSSASGLFLPGRFRLFGLFILREWSRCHQLSGPPCGIPSARVGSGLRHKAAWKVTRAAQMVLFRMFCVFIARECDNINI